MKVSLILATADRQELLMHAVVSILNQTYTNFEIIIIDQSDVFNNDVSKLDNRIKYYHINQRGLSMARNIGIKSVTGEVVGFMDDDAFYTESVLENVVSIFKKNNNNDIGLVCGKVVDCQTGEIYLRGMDNKFKCINLNNVLKCCISAAMFIKADFLRNNMFDERFGVGRYWGSAEETDVALRLLYQGYKGVFDPKIVVKHPGCVKSELSFKKLESYSLGFGALVAKHILEYDNKRLMYMYILILLKQIVGIALSVFTLNMHMINYYVVSLEAKVKGYFSYKNYKRKCY